MCELFLKLCHGMIVHERLAQRGRWHSGIIHTYLSSGGKQRH